MNKILFCLFLVLLFSPKVTCAQDSKKVLDSLTVAKLSISGFCLCKTSITDLRHMTDDFKEVDVEEMDYPKKCGGSDGRFTGGQGVYSEKFKGMIFQNGNLSDYVGKIRLTKDFSGTLPNGSFVDLRAMKLRDVFVIYPELKESWGSRGCSDYWNFSDKTISFYVRIDKAIQPQFPINESYYLDKPIEGIDLVASCYGLIGPKSKPLQFFRPDEPMYFVDSIRTNESFIKEAYQPSEFAAITVVKGDNAIKIAGQEGKNGIVYIFTKSYAREKYFRIFKSKSAAYRKAIKSPDETGVVYILGEKVLKENPEGELLNVADNDSLEIEVLDKNQLKKKYGEKGKIGVILKTTK